ncbi:MAG: cation diffusion facilitator family transporter [Bacteroidales bacterium]
MGHNHNHSHNSDSEKNLSIVFFLNSLFVIVELVGGIMTNSIAILSDALHDFGDSLSLALAWFLQRKSKSERDEKYSYGYKRFSLLGSVFLSGVLTVSSLFVIVEAVKRVITPAEVSAQGMLWFAIFGIIINGAAAFRVKGGASINERSVYIHIMEDVLGWVAVLIVSIVMMFIDVPILDPILSLCISVWVLVNVYKNTKATFRVFLQAIPEDITPNNLKEEILGISGIISIHDMHLWSLDGESHVMTLHVVTSEVDIMQIKESVLEIAQEYNITHSTIEFEAPGSKCLTSCGD